MDRVLVIDEKESRWEIMNGLEEMGFQVDGETCGAGGLQQIQRRLHHVIMMDEDMPPVASTELLADLRAATERPIVVLGQGQETAMVEALLRGADVYAERSMPMRELAARVRALARRCQQCVTFEGWAEALFDGPQLSSIFAKLSQTEAKLLRFLLERDGQLTAREELMAGVWGENGKETSLRFYIWQLRRKLNGVAQIEIMNMKGMGYLLKVHPAS